MRPEQLKHLPAAPFLLAFFVVLIVAVSFSRAGEMSIQVPNLAPAFKDLAGNPIEPSDGGVSAESPVKSGDAVTFTATAADANGDAWYLAICKTGSVTPKDGRPPFCNDGEWIKSRNPVASGSRETLVYAVRPADRLLNDWFAFACDAVKRGSACSGAGQGVGEFGSPFAVSKKVGMLRFGGDCPEVRELEALNPEGRADLSRKMSRGEALRLIEDGLNAGTEPDDPILKTALRNLRESRVGVRLKERNSRRGALDEIGSAADALEKKRGRLAKLDQSGVRFCVLPTDDDSVGNILSEAGAQAKASNRIRNEIEGGKGRAVLGVEYLNDEKRSIVINFSRDAIILRSDPSRAPDRALILRHESPPPDGFLPGAIQGLFGSSASDRAKDPGEKGFRMEGVEGRTVVYQSLNNRKTDLYKNGFDPLSATPYSVKNYTIYHFGDGKESELYTIENAVLKKREDGRIEGYYKRMGEIVAEVHEKGKPDPDFFIQAPVAVDKNGNVLDTLKYSIEGEGFNQLAVSFSCDPKDYPVALDPTLTFPAASTEVSDGGSSASSPTSVGGNVSFTGTASGNQWYMAVCKTDSVTPGVSAAPTCATDQTWGISALTGDGSQATVTYAAQAADPETNVWYAFACEHAAGATCSASSQGSGNNGSPFVVNHAPTYSGYSATDSAGGSIAPDDDVKFTVTTADADSDTVALYVCTSATTSFSDGTCTGGAVICNSAQTAAGSSVNCPSTTLADSPMPDTGYNVKVYLLDGHSLEGSSDPAQAYTVIDVDPTLVSYANPIDPGSIAAGSSESFDFSATFSDLNGYADITAVSGGFWDDAVKDYANCDSAGEADENDCYFNASCSSASNDGSKQNTFTCTVTLWFNANASSDWETYMIANGVISFTPVNYNNAISATSAIDICTNPGGACDQASVSYGSLVLGGTSSGQEISMGNAGNQPIDALLNGTDFSDGASHTISAAQQKYHHSTQDFTYASSGYVLITGAPSTGTNETGGCLNRDLAVLSVHNNRAPYESIYFKMKAPDAQVSGSYTGTISFYQTSGASCSGYLDGNASCVGTSSCNSVCGGTGYSNNGGYTCYPAISCSGISCDLCLDADNCNGGSCGSSARSPDSGVTCYSDYCQTACTPGT